MIQRLFTTQEIKSKPNHTLNGGDQLTTHVKVFPCEVSLLWEKESYGWLIPHDNDDKYLILQSQHSMKTVHTVFPISFLKYTNSETIKFKTN